MQMWRGEPNIPFSQYWEKVGVARLRVHSDFVGVETPTYKNICPPEFISGSYQRCISSFNENTFLRSNYTLKTGKILWRNQTFFTKSKISEKAVKQVQHDKMSKTLHSTPNFLHNLLNTFMHDIILVWIWRNRQWAHKID